MDLINLGSVATAALEVLRWRFIPGTRNAAKKKKKKNQRTTNLDRLCGLEIVASDSESPDVDICFVHGLTGDAKSTWTSRDAETNEDVFWPTAFLSKQTSLDDGRPFPRTRIMLYGYETAVNSLCWLTERTLYHHASHLLNELSEARKDCRDRPLLFIVHSLGGLLVQNALIFSFSAARENSEDIESPSLNGDIYLSTFGIVSFGTPQTFPGNTPLTELVDHLCRIPDFLGSKSPIRTPEFEDFGKESWKEDVKGLQQRLHQYHHLAKEIPEVFCFESSKLRDTNEEPISTIDMTVPKKARYIHEKSVKVPIRRNHAELAHFFKRDDGYWKICTSIYVFHQRSKTDLQTRRKRYVKDLDLTLITSERVRDTGFAVDSELPPMPTYISGILPKSRQDYLDILHQRLNSDRHAVLTGELGCGKTTLALVYAYQQREEKPSRFSSIFWLNASNELCLESSFMKIARQLRTHYNRQENRNPESADHAEIIHNLIREGDRKVTVRAVLNWLSYPENKRWLLIYDEVERLDAPYLDEFVPSIKTLKADRGYIIITSKDARERDQIHLEKLKPESSYRPRWLGSTPVEETKPEPSAEGREFISEPIRVGSFNRDESVEFIKQMYDRSKTPEEDDGNIRKRRISIFWLETLLIALAYQTFTNIADSVKDVPQDIAFVGAFISSSKSLQRVQEVLERKSLQFVEVPQKYAEWFKTCVMLGPGPIPILLVQVFFNIKQEDVVDSLNELQAKGLIWVKENSEFEIPEIHRRPRCQALEGVFLTAAKYAGFACDSLIRTALHLKSDSKTTYVRETSEQALLKHIGTCLSHYSRYKHSWEGAYEWDVLAELCEQYRLYSEAATLYGAAYRRGFTNQSTASQASQPYGNIQTDETLDFDWPRSDDLSPSQIWRPPCEGADFNLSYETNTSVDTKTSRKLRSELGLIRMQLLLSRFHGSKTPSEDHDEQFIDPDARCQEIMRQVESRHEDRYLSLKIEALKRSILFDVRREDWSDAIQASHTLIDLLESAFGSSSPDTTKAIQHLAEIHMKEADYRGAEPLLKRVLMTYEQKFGRFHEMTIAILDLLARAYKEQGDMRRARDSYRVVIDANRVQLGEDHIETAKAKENLANVYFMMEEYSSAAELYTQAVHAAKLLGEKSPEYERMTKHREQLRQLRRNEATSSAV